MTTPPAPPAPSGPHGFVGWLEEHVFPSVKELAADAEKAREVIPLVLAYLPKIVAAAQAADPALATALAPYVAEAEQILALLADLGETPEAAGM